jgi:hypothetical protein
MQQLPKKVDEIASTVLEIRLPSVAKGRAP